MRNPKPKKHKKTSYFECQPNPRKAQPPRTNPRNPARMPAHAHAQHLRKSIDPNVSTNMSPTKAENTDTKHRYRNTGRKHRHRNHINIAYKPIQSLCQKAPSTIGFATTTTTTTTTTTHTTTTNDNNNNAICY